MNLFSQVSSLAHMSQELCTGDAAKIMQATMHYLLPNYSKVVTAISTVLESGYDEAKI